MHRLGTRKSRTRQERIPLEVDLTPDGPGATVVTETYDCTDSPVSVRKAVDNGRAWLAGMTETLERLDRLCKTPVADEG